MDTANIRKEIREVRGFDQVSILGNICSTQVFITQTDEEGLTIEAPEEYLGRLRSEVKDGKLTIRMQGSWLQDLEDALSTCLNRPHIVYRLDICRLTTLEVQCAYYVQLSSLETPQLNLRLNGAGDFKLDRLSAKTLVVHHAGTGIVRISGQIEEQKIVLNGVGHYIAPELNSQRARVVLSGAGSARVWVSQALDATLRGVGVIEYSGHPTVSKLVSGPGQVVHAANTLEKSAWSRRAKRV